MSKLRIIVLGASGGGVAPLREVMAGLPADLRAAVLVVLHIPPYRASMLPAILGRAGPLPAHHAVDGEALKAGHIYVAPPDHHLLVDGRRLAVKRGPKENRFRPSIDALFRSAAYSAGPNVTGVILSGALDDGTSGLWTVKRLGGMAIVQRPSDAQVESMPLSALQEVEIDYNVPAREIGPLIDRLVKEPLRDVPGEPALRKRLKIEIGIATEDAAFQKGVMEIGSLTPFTCPECHGALVKIPELTMNRFRCHTGHAYTDSSLLEAVAESTGEMLSQVMRSYEEAVMLLREMAGNLERSGDAKRATPFLAKAKELERRSRAMHDSVLQHENLSGDNLGQLERGE